MMAKIKLLLEQERGFTLIELMLVIAVLGTLAGIAVPRMGGILDRADQAEVEADFSMIRNALEMYRIDSENREYPEEDDAGAPDANLEEYGLSQEVIDKFTTTNGEAVYSYERDSGDEYEITTTGTLDNISIKLTQDGIEDDD